MGHQGGHRGTRRVLGVSPRRILRVTLSCLHLFLLGKLRLTVLSAWASQSLPIRVYRQTEATDWALRSTQNAQAMAMWSGKDTVFCATSAIALSFTSCVISGSFINLSGPQFFSWENGNDHRKHLTELLFKIKRGDIYEEPQLASGTLNSFPFSPH